VLNGLVRGNWNSQGSCSSDSIIFTRCGLQLYREAVQQAQKADDEHAQAARERVRQQLKNRGEFAYRTMASNTLVIYVRDSRYPIICVETTPPVTSPEPVAVNPAGNQLDAEQPASLDRPSPAPATSSTIFVNMPTEAKKAFSTLLARCQADATLFDDPDFAPSDQALYVGGERDPMKEDSALHRTRVETVWSCIETLMIAPVSHGTSPKCCFVRLDDTVVQTEAGATRSS
jgi:hypothetical protein